ncbi:MAG: relaxase domain-containing protein [Dermatophilaceae bacterium]
MRFEEQPSIDARKRPVREIVGADARLAMRWSARRASIEARAACSRPDSRQPTAALPPPSSPSSWRIRQPWETCDPKHEPRSLDEQRSTWARQAREVLGSDQAVHALVRRTPWPPQGAHGHRVDAAWMHATAPARPQRYGRLTGASVQMSRRVVMSSLTSQ